MVRWSSIHSESGEQGVEPCFLCGVVAVDGGGGGGGGGGFLTSHHAPVSQEGL